MANGGLRVSSNCFLTTRQMGYRVIYQSLPKVPAAFGCELQRRDKLRNCRGIVAAFRESFADENLGVSSRGVGVLSPEPIALRAATQGIALFEFNDDLIRDALAPRFFQQIPVCQRYPIYSAVTNATGTARWGADHLASIIEGLSCVDICCLVFFGVHYPP